MATLNTPAPVEPVKSGDYLHDRSRIPEVPKATVSTFLSRNMLLVAGVLLTLAFTALVFQTRAAWGSHRDWVPPAGIQAMALAGVALGYLVARKKFGDAALPLGFIVLAGFLTVFNLLRGYETDGDDALRDFMSVLTAIFMGLAVITALFAFIKAEVTDPTKAPQPET